MILVCSKASLNHSWWVNKEIKEARKKEETYFKQTKKEINIISQSASMIMYTRNGIARISHTSP
ncbi:MAG: hypothetical protein ACI9AT_001386, partial [Ulvibacter sp.]